MSEEDQLNIYKYAEKLLVQTRRMPDNFSLPLPAKRVRWIAEHILNKQPSKPDNRLTDVEKSVLQAVKADLDIGKRPTIRSVAERLDYDSPRSAQVVIDRLIEFGYLAREGRNKEIVVVEKTN